MRETAERTMIDTRIVSTSLGDVEIAVIEGRLPPVLFFPGGHCPADIDCGWDLYTRLGHGVVSFSRPGYGRTQVGDLTAAQFVPAIEEVRSAVAPGAIAAVVGTSFGGMQAVHAAVSPRLAAPRLVLHSAAPSTLSYPDSPAERAAGPIVFSPRIQHVSWAAISRLVSTERGLRLMCRSLSRLPPRRWWPTWTPQDRAQARAIFQGMRSGRGFVNDLQQATSDTRAQRRRVLEAVSCPTLITGTRNDGGVDFAHAEDLAHVIRHARSVELEAPNHLFWIGPQAEDARHAVRDFMND